MRYLLAVTFLFGSIYSFAQTVKNDSTNWFQEHFSGNWRNYYLSTNNKGDLKNFRALATGGNIVFKQSIKGFLTINAGGYFSVNTGIQDLTVPDPTTGKVSRYEAGLFNVTDLQQQFIPIFGIANVTLNKKGNELIIGRMNLKSPFVNPQDGRMIPTLEEGVWYSNSNIKNTKISLGAIHKIAPRSTGGFYKIGESVGTYPQGRNIEGTAAQYAGNTDSDYMVIGNIMTKPHESLIFHLWNYYTDNIHNTTYARGTWTTKKRLSISAEWLHQQKVGDGGNADPGLAYYQFEKSDVVGIQAKSKGLTFSYNYIFPHGQFIFPREWGRENLFTFQKRERSEGSANNHAVVVGYKKVLNLDDHKITPELTLGRHFKPQVSEFDQNKYALPSYYQMNFDVFYSHKKLKGWEAELLLTYKKSAEDVTNPQLLLNKVDLFITNIIVNYRF